MKKILVSFAMVLLMLLPCKVGKAQLPVTDIASILSATASAAQNLAAAMETIGISADNLEQLRGLKDKFSEWNENIQAAKDYLESVNNYYELVKMIGYQVQFINSYIEAIKKTASDKLNPYALSYILNYAAESIRSVDTILETVDRIAREIGIDKGTKQELIQQQIETAKRRLIQSTVEINEELLFLEGLGQIADLQNLMMGRRPGTGLNAYGASASYVDMSGGDDVSVTAGDGLKEGGSASVYFNSNGLGSITSVWFRMIYVIIGILCSGSLIFAFVKYTQGAPGAEMMFVRIAAIGIIVIVALSLVNNIVFN